MKLIYSSAIARRRAKRKLASALVVATVLTSASALGFDGLRASPQEDLFTAIARGRVADVGKLLSEGVSVEGRNEDGNTALIEASIRGNKAIIDLLLEKGADINASGKDGNSGLHFASTHRSDATTEHLLAKGARIGALNKAGETALHTAARTDGFRSIAALLKSGLDANIRDGNGDTALHTALRNKRYYAAKALIDAKVDLNAQDAAGHTPIRIALDVWYTPNIRLLLVPGVDVDLADKQKDSAVHISAAFQTTYYVEQVANLSKQIDVPNGQGETPLLIAIRRNRPANVAVYLKRGANANASYPDGSTALGRAVHDAQSGVVRALCDAKANPNTKIESEWLVVDAALKNRADMVEALLKAGASADATTKTGVPILLAAYAASRWYSVTTLIKSGANVNAKDHNGETALLMAARLGHPGNLQLLLQHKAGSSVKDANGDPALLLGAESGNTSVINLLLGTGADVNIRGARGETALLRAVSEGHDAAVTLLLANGANPNLKNDQGDSAMNAALLKGREGAFRALIKSGASLRTKDAMGNTLLMEAARAEPGRLSEPVLRMMDQLLKAGLPADEPNLYGSNALSIAMNRRNAPALKVLLATKPDLERRSKTGHTILHKTVLSGLFGDAPPHLDPGPEGILEIFQQLIAHGALIDTTDNEGQTPLISTMKGASERTLERSLYVVRLLLDLGANTEVRDQSGRTASEYAQAAPSEVGELFGRLLARDTFDDDHQPLLVATPEEDRIVSVHAGGGRMHAMTRSGPSTSLVTMDESGRIISSREIAGLQAAVSAPDGKVFTVRFAGGSGDKRCKANEDLQVIVELQGDESKPQAEWKQAGNRTCLALALLGAHRYQDTLVVALRFGTRDDRLYYFDMGLKQLAQRAQGYWDDLIVFGDESFYLRGNYTYHYKGASRIWVRKTQVDANQIMGAFADGDFLSAGSGPQGTISVQRRNSWFTPKWHTMFGKGKLSVQAVATDKEGNAYLAGTVNGSIHQGQSQGGSDVFVIKVDPDGKRLWTRQFGSSADDSVDQLLVLGERLLVVGTVSGTFEGRRPAGGKDAFVVKFSLDGKRARRKAGLFG